MADDNSMTPETQLAIDVAVAKATIANHERRVTALERMQTQALVTGLVAALSSAGTLIMFILSKVGMHP